MADFPKRWTCGRAMLKGPLNIGDKARWEFMKIWLLCTDKISKISPKMFGLAAPYYHVMTFWNFGALSFVPPDTKWYQPRTFLGLCLNCPIHKLWILFKWNQIWGSCCRKGYLLKECHRIVTANGTNPRLIWVTRVTILWQNMYTTTEGIGQWLWWRHAGNTMEPQFYQ